MAEKHLSSQFDSELNQLSTQMMEMGGLIESQIQMAAQALTQFSMEDAEKVMAVENRVDTMEVSIDRSLSSIIARRQPTARDLRLLMAISKATANLERMGDEANKIARMVKAIIEGSEARKMPVSELRIAANLAARLTRNALDAFARLDIPAALATIREDGQIDVEFEGFTRILITYMMEDPRTIRSSLNLLFIAKAIERIGDHASNIAELVIYIVNGTDVRHSSITEIESALR